MLSTRANARLCTPKQAAQFSRLAAATLLRTTTAGSSHRPSPYSIGYGAGLRVGSPSAAPTTVTLTFTAGFATTPAARLRDFFPSKETAHIRKSPPAWAHPGYTEEEMLNVVPAHREPRTMGDWFAYKFVKLCRWGMDLATGIKPDQQTDLKNPTTAVVADKPLTEAQWVSCRAGTLSFHCCPYAHMSHVYTVSPLPRTPSPRPPPGHSPL